VWERRKEGRCRKARREERKEYEGTKDAKEGR
jgi:hypothetical protein